MRYILFLLIFFLFFVDFVLAQNRKTDTLARKKEKEISLKDTTKKQSDSLQIKGDIKTTIKYSAEDSIVSNLLNNTVYLYGNAKINYGDIELTAAEIEINQVTSTVTARPDRDSTGRLIQKPVFMQGSDKYEADSMRYNFKSEKGVIYGVVTQQNEGFIIGSKSKRDEKGVFYAATARYTTCNLAHPHWYINASKIKMIPEKQVITGPFNMVIGDVPTPLGFAFGVFPISETRRSGIIIPQYGEDATRGFFFREGGYFWAISDKVVATFLGEIYTNGSWGLNVNTQYNRRYRFSGIASVRLNRRVFVEGERELKNFQQDFWINWTHSPTPRGRSTFAASVSLGSSRFNELNDFSANNFLSNNFNSSISYSTGFDIGSSAVNLSISLRQDQSTRTRVMNATIPEINLGINRIYPFKKRGQSARNFLQQVNLSYNMFALTKFTNQPPNYNGFGFNVANAPRDSLGMILTNQEPLPFVARFSEVSKFSQIGITHSIPLSTTIKVFKYINVNPSISYNEVWFPRRLNYTWQEAEKGVRIDTLRQFSRVFNYSAAASLTTRLFGILNLDPRNKGKKIQGIRHTMIPTVSYAFSPDLSGDRLGFFQTVQVDSAGTQRSVSRYQGFEPGAPIGSSRSATLNFALNNVFEMKVRGQTDTSASKKINLLENLSLNASYNILADSFNLSTISIAARTRITQLVDLNFTGILDPYVYQITDFGEDGRVTSQKRLDLLKWNSGGGIGQLNNFNVSIGMNFTPSAFKKKTADKAKEASIKSDFDTGLNPDAQRQLDLVKNNPEMYVDFDIPWNLRANYNISYNKLGFLASEISQTLNFSGDLSFTKTWKLGFTSGYDFQTKAISFTTIDIYKDLHCWEMRLSWIPFGQRQSYTFDINIKSSVLRDLRLSRRRSWYDRDFPR